MSVPPVSQEGTGALPYEREERPLRESRGDPFAALLLAAVVAGFICLCVVVIRLDRFWTYDEAVYLSQVYPGHPLPFNAQRARGLPWLLWPMGVLQAPPAIVRGYLLMINAGLMYLGFRAWLPILRRRTALAATLFGLTWLSIFEATEAFPNLPLALLAVGAAGYLARSALTADHARRTMSKAALALGLAAVIRPIDATFVAAGLVIAAALLPARFGVRTDDQPAHATEVACRWAFLLCGLAIGWVPWLIEAVLRFGGPIERLRAAGDNVSGGWHPGNIERQLALTNGPLTASATGPAGPAPMAGVFWWTVLPSVP